MTEKIINSDLKNRVFTEIQLKHLLEDSPQSRYGMMHRAMQSGEIQRIRRGVYTLAKSWRDVPCHPFAIAAALYPLSYISFETALSWHGWIPESVVETASVIPRRKKGHCEHPDFGIFTFYPLALEKIHFLQGVERLQFDGQTFLVAHPLRALFDLVCQRKIEWSASLALTQGLRIDEEFLQGVSGVECKAFIPVYKHRRMRHFIASLATQLSDGGGRV